MNFNQRIKLLVNKIVKIKNKNIIEQILLKDTGNSNKKFIKISKLIHSSHQLNQNRLFISTKLANFISKYFNNKKQLYIADIGGAEGYVLKEIGEMLQLTKKHLYCIEPLTPWTESYNFLNDKYIQYVFWDGIEIKNLKPLDIVIIMVSLHHMTDDTMKNLFSSINVKPGGLLIIKEHDCNTPEDKYVINWEHHLYHLSSLNIQNEDEIKNYKQQYIDNYKSKNFYDEFITLCYGYEPILELNRLFENNNDYKNPTNLYWKIYRKK